MKCEVCGHDDIETYVASSTLGAVSFNYCLICGAVGAEPRGFEEISGDYITYDKEADRYKFQEKFLDIDFKSGASIKTRTEAVKILKKIQ